MNIKFRKNYNNLPWGLCLIQIPPPRNYINLSWALMLYIISPNLDDVNNKTLLKPNFNHLSLLSSNLESTTIISSLYSLKVVFCVILQNLNPNWIKLIPTWFVCVCERERERDGDAMFLCVWESAFSLFIFSKRITKPFNLTNNILVTTNKHNAHI